MRGFDTFVPAQDKNRIALSRKLGEFATLDQYPPFTYPTLLARGRTVDVTWFRRGLGEVRMPNTFFEVEHSTDFQNSLLKFADLRDFRAEFVIVADALRKPEYEAKRSASAFEPIQPLVTFWSYNRLISEYEKRSELYALEQAA